MIRSLDLRCLSLDLALETSLHEASGCYFHELVLLGHGNCNAGAFDGSASQWCLSHSSNNLLSGICNRNVVIDELVCECPILSRELHVIDDGLAAELFGSELACNLGLDRFFLRWCVGRHWCIRSNRLALHWFFFTHHRFDLWHLWCLDRFRAGCTSKKRDDLNWIGHTFRHAEFLNCGHECLVHSRNPFPVARPTNSRIWICTRCTDRSVVWLPSGDNLRRSIYHVPTRSRVSLTLWHVLTCEDLCVDAKVVEVSLVVSGRDLLALVVAGELWESDECIALNLDRSDGAEDVSNGLVVVTVDDG